MNSDLIERDERTIAVEGIAYRWSYILISMGVLALAAYRSFAKGESTWDLLILVMVGGAANALYQGSKKVLLRRWAIHAGVAAVVGAVLALAGVFLRGGR